jgi:hypothetical protein
MRQLPAFVKGSREMKVRQRFFIRTKQMLCLYAFLARIKLSVQTAFAAGQFNQQGFGTHVVIDPKLGGLRRAHPFRGYRCRFDLW